MISLQSECHLCQRLSDFRTQNKQKYPSWHNAPVPSYGDPEASILIVGLAPGLSGANRTGRPFTGDFAGRYLFESLLRTGLAKGTYDEDATSEFALEGLMITNAVACVPPQNKPNSGEEANCRPFLLAQISRLKNLHTIITLGEVARRNVLKALNAPQSSMRGGHGIESTVDNYRLINSFHCSRLNVNTRRLTTEMLDAIFIKAIEKP